MRGRGDGDVEGRLEVGLVEAREHPLRVSGFELRVEVDLVVDRVDEAVQTFAGVGVEADGLDDEGVALLQAGQRDADGLVVAGDVEVDPVEGGALNAFGGDVDVGVGSGQRLEFDGCEGPERLFAGRAGAVGEVEVDEVAVDGDERGSFDGLVAGQIGEYHTSNLVAPPVAGRSWLARQRGQSGNAGCSVDQSGQALVVLQHVEERAVADRPHHLRAVHRDGDAGEERRQAGVDAVVGDGRRNLGEVLARLDEHRADPLAELRGEVGVVVGVGDVGAIQCRQKGVVGFVGGRRRGQGDTRCEDGRRGDKRSGSM